MRGSLNKFLILLLIAAVVRICVAKDPPVSEPIFVSIHHDSLITRTRVAVLIPGMNQTCFSPGYDSIGIYYKCRNINPVYVNIKWKAVGFKSLTDVSFQLQKILIDSFPNAHYYLFGFSFGAVISLKLSQMINADHILLCSMSPMFEEDRTYQIFPFKQLLGLFTDYKSNGLSFSSSKETCVIFLYGEHDSFAINKKIIQNRKDYFTCSETILVPNARHDISGRSYLTAIQQIVERINK